MFGCDLNTIRVIWTSFFNGAVYVLQSFSTEVNRHIDDQRVESECWWFFQLSYRLPWVPLLPPDSLPLVKGIGIIFSTWVKGYRIPVLNHVWNEYGIGDWEVRISRLALLIDFHLNYFIDEQRGIRGLTTLAGTRGRNARHFWEIPAPGHTVPIATRGHNIYNFR
jgi:hypothetical protein